MLVELGLVGQQAVLEIPEGATSVTDVARRYVVSRQSMHKWLVRYGTHGLAGLIDKSSRPDTCPYQMPPTVESRVLEMRRVHPERGPRTILKPAGHVRSKPVRSSLASGIRVSDAPGG